MKEVPNISELDLPKFNKANWIAYLSATLIAFVSSQVGFGIPTINGVVSAVVLAIIVNKVFEKMGLKEQYILNRNKTLLVE